MAASQFTIPIDIDNEGLKRLLKELAGTIDAITGIVKDDSITSLPTLESAINDINESITEINTELNDLTTIVNNKEPQEEIDDINSNISVIFTHAVLDSSYYDFDHANWGTLEGAGRFTALGSALSSAPFTPIGGTTYTIYAESYVTADNGAVQRVLVEEVGVSLTVHYRTGLSFALMISNSWITVPDLSTLVATLGSVVDNVLKYVARSTSNYIDGNSDINEDLTDLDAQIKINADDIGDNVTDITALNDKFSSGSWTPSLEGSGTAGTPTYTVRVGTYTVVDGIVTAFFDVIITTTTGMVGNLKISGFPFNQADGNALGVIQFMQRVTYPAGTVDATISPDGTGTSKVTVVFNGSGLGNTALNVTNINVGGNTRIRGSLRFKK